MARRVRDAILGTRNARSKLKARGKPYYRSLLPGLHVGYRKNASGGRWVIRIYTGDQTYHVSAFADADDVADANGTTVLDYWQAQQKAHELKADLERSAAAAAAGAPTAAMTIADAVEAYAAKRDARDSRRADRPVHSGAWRRLTRHVTGRQGRGRRKAIPAAPLAAIALAALTEADLRTWRKSLPVVLKATTIARTANDLKAALNAAAETHGDVLGPSLAKVIKRGLKPERNDAEDVQAVSRARDSQILETPQLAALLAAAREVDTAQDWDGDVFRLILLLAATGARFSQLVRMQVNDVQIEQRRLMVPVSRKGTNSGGKTGLIAVPVGDDIIDALRPAITGRPGTAVLLERWRLRQVTSTHWERDFRQPWRSASELARPWSLIRERAGLPENIVAYALRHSSIVRAISAGLPVRLVAACHDTSTTMIERHYARWISSGLEELMRQAIVPLVPPASPGSNVIPLKGGGAS